ncbi:MAG: ATP-dependent DNA helicase RecG, partial [Proteobacteria bacterium]|nr:ATP-dependent DNA helicase RecG [Pseudomonadota bacterium]
MPSNSARKSDEIVIKGRPFALDPLFARATGLPGVGPRTAKLFEKLCGGDKVVDLLWHKPIDFVDRRFAPKVKDAPAGTICTLTLHVQKHFPNERRNQPYKVWCTDDTGGINLVFFNPHKDFIKKQLPEGAQAIVSGKIDYYQGKPQITHPDAIGPIEDRALIETLEPVYPLTAGVTNKAARKAIHYALEKLPDLPEWLDPAWKKKNGWEDWKPCVQALHNPPGAGALEPASPARARLAYDELLAGQLALALVRLKTKKQQGRVFKGDGSLRRKVLAALPFKLTGAQERSLK